MFKVFLNTAILFNNSMGTGIKPLENVVTAVPYFLYVSILSAIAIVTLIYGKKIYLYIQKFIFSFVAAIKSLFKEHNVQKITEHHQLDKVIAVAGYGYDKNKDIFYSKMNAWQRKMGYCRLYDETASVFGMVIDSEPIFFECENKKWLIEFWKGQYDLSCGAEVGIYTSDKMDVNVAGVFEGTFYECARNKDMLYMKFTLIKNDETLFVREGRHWWLTGFRLGEFARPDELKMVIEITLKNNVMQKVFIDGLLDTGYKRQDIKTDGNTVIIEYNKPKTKQPVTRSEKSDKIILDNSQALCNTYQSITEPYDTMQEKISAIMTEAPQLYKHIINIGKSEQIFFKSDIIRKAIKGKKSKERIMTVLTDVYNNAKRISYRDSSKIVIMSDVHRGVGRKHDNFVENKDLFMSVLMGYYRDDFTYIELGDGEELWENRSIAQIIETYLDVYLLLKKFYRKKRLYFIYGNHDMEKRRQKYVEENLYQYYDAKSQKYKNLFKGIKTHEALVLQHKGFNGDMFLLHGHQVDFLNNKLWRIARFLVRVLWKPLEHVGIKDPTRTAKVYEKKKSAERKLTEWIIDNKVMMITGHTHKPMFSDFDTPAYFNDGSCVSDDAITAIEIETGEITLVKWFYKMNDHGDKIRTREVLAGPVEIRKYFDYQAECEKTTA